MRRLRYLPLLVLVIGAIALWPKVSYYPQGTAAGGWECSTSPDLITCKRIAITAPPPTRDAVLAMITNANGVIVGQHLGYDINSIESPNWTWNYTHTITSLVRVTGRHPALVAGQYGEGASATADGIHRLNQLLIRHWNAGNLIQVEFAATNPWTGGKARDPYRTTLQDLLLPGPPHDAWIAEMSMAHAGLAKLRDAGVVVLWRPFGEMTYNGSNWWDAGGNWWGWSEGKLTSRPQTIAGFAALWRDMYQRFADLDNLIWVYGAANQDYCIDVDALWPGNAYVDVAGFSMYQNDVTGNPFPKLAAHNKPIAFTEFGLAPRDGTTDLVERLALLKRYPQVKYVLHWHSWDATTGLAAIVDQAHAAEYMNDAYVITRERLK